LIGIESVPHYLIIAKTNYRQINHSWRLFHLKIYVSL